jgi:hypothetical protein
MPQIRLSPFRWRPIPACLQPSEAVESTFQARIQRAVCNDP